MLASILRGRNAEPEIEIERLQKLLLEEMPLDHAEIGHGLGANAERNTAPSPTDTPHSRGANVLQLQKVRRKLIADKAARVVVVLRGRLIGHVRRLGHLMVKLVVTASPRKEPYCDPDPGA